MGEHVLRTEAVLGDIMTEDTNVLGHVTASSM